MRPADAWPQVQIVSLIGCMTAAIDSQHRKAADCWEPKPYPPVTTCQSPPAAALFRPFLHSHDMACCVKPVGRGGSSDGFHGSPTASEFLCRPVHRLARHHDQRPSLAREPRQPHPRPDHILLRVAATVAWQSYRRARERGIATSYPHLSFGWQPQAPPLAQTASDCLRGHRPPPPSPSWRQLSLAFATVRQSVTTSPASQQQMADGVAKLRRTSEELLHKISIASAAASPHPPAPNPWPLPAVIGRKRRPLTPSG